MKNLLNISILIIFISLVTGCTSDEKQMAGTAGGAVIGGMAGHAIGGSTAATIGGAVVGGVIGNQVSKSY